MKTEKLTLQDCFKYHKAMINDYTGSKDNPTGYRNIFKYIYSLGEFDGANIQTTSEDDCNMVYISNCKLILRPLSSLTDEEGKYIQSRLHRNIPLYWNKINNINELVYILERESIIPLCDYLRSINIDIDGMEEKGKAVYQ